MTDDKKDPKILKDPKETKGSKISKSVKAIIDSVEKLTVLELADLVSALEEKFGVSAAPAAAVQAAGPTASAQQAPAEEKSAYDVVLKSAGSQKIQVIKAVRVLKPDIGLADAKKLVESAPAAVLAKAKKEDAQTAKKKLEEAGAVVELK